MAESKNKAPAHLGTFNSDGNFRPHGEHAQADTRIDKFTFFGVLVILLGVTLPLVAFPQQGADWVALAKAFVTDNFGVAYLAFGVLSVLFVVYIAASDIGNIKLGKPEDAVEFQTGSWAAMMFCGGIGASILYWGIVEWMYYYQSPPFGVEAKSPDAVRWASTYGMFHWGLWRGRFTSYPLRQSPILPMCAIRPY